ncbi:MAG: LeuD/DmdB family oxidoreductase small subunit [Candidatus Thorarchaeota archaeon]
MTDFEKIKGRGWVFGNNIDTDQIIPGQYLALLNYSEMAQHTFENARSDFVKHVQQGDIIIAGKNFGSGSSREEAPMVLKELGISLVIAESFSRIFYRNAFNIGVPALIVPDILEHAKDGMALEVNLISGEVIIIESGKTLHGDKLPEMMLELLKAGGAITMHISRQRK